MSDNNFFQLVAELKKNIDWLNKILIGDNYETVAINDVIKPTISKDIQDKWSLLDSTIVDRTNLLISDINHRWEAIQALVSGRLAFRTKNQMITSGAPPTGVSLAQVWGDSSNNGLYGWSGTEWVKSEYDNEEKLNRISDGVSQTALPFLKSIISDETVPVFSRGNYNAAGSNILNTIFGWKSAFKHNGSSFDTVELNVRTLAETDVLLTIETAENVVLARAVSRADNTNKVRLFALDKMIWVANETILYMGYRELHTRFGISFPAGGDYADDDVDPNVNVEQYVTDMAWLDVTTPGSYRIQFRLINSQQQTSELNIPKSLSKIPALINDLKTKINLDDWQKSSANIYGGDPQDELFDSRYDTARGMGTTLLPQQTELKFNKLSVFGGVTSRFGGLVVLRIYLSDFPTPSPYIPSKQTLLSQTEPLFWTRDIEKREIHFDQILTIPANKFVGFLWVTLSGGVPSIARWTHDGGGGIYPLQPFIFVLSGFGENAFDLGWSFGSNSFLTVPPILELLPKIIEDKTKQNVLKPILTIPNIVVCVVGTELNIYYDSILLGMTNQEKGGVDGINVQIHGSVGRSLERQYQITPTSAQIGTHNMTIKIYDNFNNHVLTHSFNLKIIAAISPTAKKNILQIGDSLNSSGQVTTPLADKFTQLGGIKPSFVGTVGDEIKYEAYGGWSFARFAQSYQSNSYRFFVTGATSIAVGSTYTNNGATFTVDEVNISGGTGNINTSKTGSNNPSPSGSLAKSSGSGDQIITFNSFVVENGNQFWNPETSEIDIAYYRNKIGLPQKIDIVTFQLGINDVGISDRILDDQVIALIINYAKSIIDAFLTDNANCKVIVGLPSLCGNTKNGFGFNYGAFYSKQSYEKNIFSLRQAIISSFDNGQYSMNVFVAATGVAIDRYYGYALSNTKVASRIDETIKVHSNAVHPATSGYEQIADAFFPQILDLIS